MEDRFELSFKNKVVRMWLYLMVPAVILQISFMLLIGAPRIIPTIITIIALIVFYVWRYFYKKKLDSIGE